MARPLDEATHRQILELSQSGFSPSEIQKIVGTGKTAVLKYRKLSLDDPLPSLQKMLRHLNANGNRITYKVRREGSYPGVGNLFLSDPHLEEYVDPHQLDYLNGYDPDTAKIRLQNFFERGTLQLRRWGYSYPYVTLLLGGDMFSGDIHEELSETNTAKMLQAVMRWLDPVGAGIKLLADEFGLVKVESTVGNHSRRTRKPRYKGRVTDNLDWLFSSVLHKMFAMDTKYKNRVEFHIPETADTFFTQFETSFLLTHGDQARGGSGKLGPLGAVHKLRDKKRETAHATRSHFDVFVTAHFHRLAILDDLVINGSLKGHDEYTQIENYGFTQPQQAVWVTVPRYGIESRCGIRVGDESEPWRTRG